MKAQREIIAVRGREDKLQISPQEQIAAQKEHGKAFASELKVVPDARDRGPVEAPWLLTPEAAVESTERKLSERHATFEHYELSGDAPAQQCDGDAPGVESAIQRQLEAGQLVAIHHYRDHARSPAVYDAQNAHHRTAN